jgi:hypothetical protein
MKMDSYGTKREKFESYINILKEECIGTLSTDQAYDILRMIVEITLFVFSMTTCIIKNDTK